jgi:hypothetical protein
MVVVVVAGVGRLAVRTYLVPRPERVIATPDQMFGSTVWVTYTPGKRAASVSITLAGLENWVTPNFEIESSEPWVPVWRGTILPPHGQGAAITFVSLPTPTEMTIQQARVLARSFVVRVFGDGQERRFDFHQAGFEHPPEPEIGINAVLAQLRGVVLMRA